MTKVWLDSKAIRKNQRGAFLSFPIRSHTTPKLPSLPKASTFISSNLAGNPSRSECTVVGPVTARAMRRQRRGRSHRLRLCCGSATSAATSDPAPDLDPRPSWVMPLLSFSYQVSIFGFILISMLCVKDIK